MATRTISNAGGNWNAAGTWVEGVVPVAADAVVATATSGNLTVNVGSGAVCSSFVLTGYTGTLNVLDTLSVAYNVTLAGTVTGSASVYLNSTGNGSSLTSNGIVWPCGIRFSSGVAKTFADAWTVTGELYVVTTPAVSGGAVTLNGGFKNTSSATFANVIHAVGGTYQNAGAGSVALSLADFRISGNITFGSVFSMCGKISWVSGTPVVTGSKLYFHGATTVDTGDHVVWNQIQTGAASTVTLLSDLHASGALTLVTYALTVNGAYSFRLSGGISGTSGSLSGTSTLVISGTCSLSGTTTLAINTDLNSAGTVTFASGGTTTIGSLKTFTHTQGTVVSTGHFLRIWGTGTYAFNGVVWDYVKIDIANGQTSTLTFGSDLNATTVDVNNTGTAILAGAYSVACGTYRQCAGSTVQLSSDTRLAVSGNLIVNGSDVLATTLSAVSGNPALCYTGALGGLRAYSLTLTNIDAGSSAIPVYLLWGTAAGCANVSVMTSAQLAVDVFGAFG